MVQQYTVESRRKSYPPDTTQQQPPMAMKHVLPNYEALNQWVDYGDFTVALDPTFRFSTWLRPGQEDRHFNSLAQDRYYIAADTLALAQMQSGGTEEPQVDRAYNPTYNQLFEMPRFMSNPSAGEQNWRGEIRSVRGAGRKPVIIDQLDRDALGHFRISKEEAERMQYLNRLNIDSNVADRSGFPDHGVPISGKDVPFSY